jgi:hypothetical protein
MIAIKKHLNLKSLVDGFKKTFNHQNDGRRQNSVTYGVMDTCLSMLACMFYKSSSLLRYQRMLEQRFYKSNLETQFGVSGIPSDNQVRTIIASVPSNSFQPIFKDYLSRLQRGKHLEKFMFQDKYLVAIDGTQYHTSEDIFCSECLRSEKRNGEIEYSHKALQPIICHPDQKQILPMMPEPIKNTDGETKQDCEINAAKRMFPKLRSQHPRMSFIWLADSVYATAPFIEMVIEHNEEYIFRIKKGDHKSLYEYIDSAEYQSHKTVMGNITIAYRWYENIPLNKSTKITVTVLKAFVIKTDREGNKKSTIAGVWATNLKVVKENVAKITKAARARWHIENQCFNAVKNQGYDLTHNWGHVKGEAFNFYILVMLGFYLHQIFELTDQLFQWCKKVCVTYRDLWDDLTALFKLFLFPSWEEMLIHCLKAKGVDPPILT